MLQAAFDDNVKLVVSLLSILNPIGAIPIFLSLTESFSKDRVKSIATSCAITVVITLAVSLIVGDRILGVFGISTASFTIGGGVLVFVMAMEMISAKHSSSKLNKKEADSLESSEIGIVPLAIPLISGPGSISTTIIYSNKMTTTYHWLISIFSILLIGVMIKVVLNYSRKIGDKLGTIGLNVMTRVMGLILLSVSIEMVAGGLRQLFPILEKAISL